jgi:L-rhamnose mutarotase
MKRIAFKMKLKAGFEEEYEKRHEKVWPEVELELKKAGVSDYSIFLDPETNTLFEVQKLTDDHSYDQLPRKEIMQKWDKFMSDILESNPDNSPVMAELKEVYRLD